MVNGILKFIYFGILFCRIFWDSSFKGKQVSLLLLIIGIFIAGITGNYIAGEITKIYLFIWAAVACVYGDLVFSNSSSNFKSGRDLLRSFSRKSFYYGLALIALFSVAVSLFIVNTCELLNFKIIEFDYFDIYPYVFYISLMGFFICWFTYHIFGDVYKMSYIDREVSFHSMILAFVSLFFVFGDVLSIKFFVMVLTTSFTCVKYIMNYRKYMLEDD